MEQCNSSEGKENQREGRSTYIGAAALYLSDDRQPEAEDGAHQTAKGNSPRASCTFVVSLAKISTAIC